MLVLHAFYLLFLLDNGLSIDIGIFLIQSRKDCWYGLCEDSCMWVHHSCEVFIVNGLINLALESGFDEVDISKCSAIGIILLFPSGYLDGSEIGIIWGNWGCGSEIRGIGYNDGDSGCIVDEAEVAHLAIAKVGGYGTCIGSGFFLDLVDRVICWHAHDGC